MASKLDRIEKDIQKTKSKIAEYQKQLRELEAQKTEQENLQIIQLVRGNEHEAGGICCVPAFRRNASRLCCHSVP